jgi:PAS domain S-box-containing protein
MRDGLGENFQRLLHGVNVKIFGVNKNGGIDIWNEKMHSATGLAPEEMLGKPLSVLRVTNEVSTLEVVIDAALKGKETFKYCYTLKSPSGVLSTVEMDVTTRRDARNYIIGALCVAQDHEGEDDMTAALESAQSALEKAMEQLQHEKLAAGDAAEKESRTRAMLDMKRRFVRGVGHEIRTPLNVVFAGLQLLESRLRGVVEDDILEVIIQLTSIQAVI